MYIYTYVGRSSSSVSAISGGNAVPYVLGGGLEHSGVVGNYDAAFTQAARQGNLSCDRNEDAAVGAGDADDSNIISARG
jgi:hypothetical protein